MKINCEIAPEFAELKSWIFQLPNIFSTRGETIFKIRNEIKVFRVGNLLLNVKEFKVPNFINRVAYVYFRKSKSNRSYIHARKCLALGTSTPAPVGHIECIENGLLTKSYYISLHLENNFTLREALLSFPVPQKKELLKQWIRFTYEKLHRNEIFHQDYSPGNTLITEKNGDYQFSIVDLNRLSFGMIRFRKGLSNFNRLEVDQSMFEFVGSEYARLRGEDPVKAARMMVEIDEDSQKKLHQKDRIKIFLARLFKFDHGEK